MKKILFFLLIIFLCAGHVNASTQVNRVVALVDGETITLFELQARLKHLLGLFEDVDIDDLPESQLEQTKRQVLNQMINDILLKKEADRFGIEVTKREIENHIDMVRSENNLSEDAFEEHLQKQRLTREAYKKQISESILRQRVLSMMVRRKVLVTMDEVETYYKENIAQYQEDTKVHLKVIILPDLEDAVRLRNEIARGEISFDDAAARFSQGPNPSQGGDLGFIDWQRLAPEWRQALDNLEQEELSQAFQVRGTGAMLKLIEKRPGGVIELSQVEDKIRQEIFDSKLDQRFEDYIRGLREKAVIDIRL
jgi:peptidyl-prolyl cis-trans isomerase SurA